MIRRPFLLLLVASGCVEPVENMESAPQEASAPVTRKILRASEIPLADIARTVPSFAGYYCEDGNLIVLDTARSKKATELVAEITVDSCAVRRSRRVAPAPAPDVIERGARFTFLELSSWRDQLSQPFLDGDGAIGVYIDYRINQVVMTGSPGALEHGRRLVSARKIPADGISLQPGGELADDFACTSTPTNLTQCFGPIPGGVRYFRTNNGQQTGGSFCTMGPAAARLTPAGWENGWVVNSHCVTRIFRNDSNWLWQPGSSSPATADFIGVETVDPNGWIGCSGTRECRYSDAAWITALPNSPVQVPERGKIAHAQFNSLNLNPVSSRFTVKSYRNAVLGMMVHKVGAVSGHTRAGVTVVCGDFNRTSGGLNIRMLCQDRAPYIRANGDSGSPVFFLRPIFGEVDIVGIHWGGDFDGNGNPGIYSPWEGVITDLGLIAANAP
jgi:hypothetical protein